jgi:hypothetical protein
MEEQQLVWRKASRSGTSNGDGNCVEVAELPDRMLVRDSTDPDGPRLMVSRDEFAALLDSLK